MADEINNAPQIAGESEVGLTGIKSFLLPFSQISEQQVFPARLQIGEAFMSDIPVVLLGRTSSLDSESQPLLV